MKFQRIIPTLVVLLVFFGRAEGAIQVITKPIPNVLDGFCYTLLDDFKKIRPVLKPLLVMAIAKGIIPQTHGGEGEGESYDIRRLGVHGSLAYEIITLDENSIYKPHRHSKSQGYFYFATGSGAITLKNKDFRYNPGDQFYVAPGLLHGFKTETQTVFLSINDPPILDSETGKVDIQF